MIQNPSKFPRRTMLLGASSAGVFATPYFFTRRAMADPKRIVVYNYDGVVGKFYEDYWINPFRQKFDVKVDTILAPGSVVPFDKLTAQIQAGHPEADVAALQPNDQVVAERNNLVMEIGDHLPEAVNYYPEYMTKYGPKLVPFAYGLAYNTKMVKAPPTRWRDMWDPAYKGLVGLNDALFEQALQMVNLTFNGRLTPVNDETFQHLTQLRPNIDSLWTTGAQAEQLLRTGEIAMTPLWNGRTFGLVDQGVTLDFAVPEEGILVRTNKFNVPRGSANPDLAIQYINFIMGAGPQQALVEKLYYGSPNKLVKYTPESAHRAVLVGDENMKRAKYEDFAALADDMGGWAKQWAKWKSS
jgi:putative spermidine/putrescine transport system substrate-binding protein